MAVDVTSLYQKCLTRKNEIDNELDTIEPGQRIPVAKRQRLQGLEKEFGDAYANFESEVSASKPLPGGRAKWERYLNQLTDEKASIRASLQPHAIEDIRQQQQDREKLVGSRDQRAMDDRGKLLTERNKMRDVDRQLDELLEMGAESRSRLQNQNAILAGAASRMVNVVESIGRGTGLVNRIDRRHLEDKILVYAGITLSMLLFIGFFIYFKWMR
mmetsp:Transcript_28621/g.72509  ORF Transcript_28621/g.72509 Transcript_28621/m.72509 type:complete len:215 (-) Transcript_28621:8-652(-)